MYLELDKRISILSFGALGTLWMSVYRVSRKIECYLNIKPSFHSYQSSSAKWVWCVCLHAVLLDVMVDCSDVSEAFRTQSTKFGIEDDVPLCFGVPSFGRLQVSAGLPSSHNFQEISHSSLVFLPSLNKD